MGRHRGSDATATRARILDAAIDLFAHKGYASTPVSELAAAIGMTQGVLYFHFRNKEDLLIATVEELERRLLVELGRESDAVEPVAGDAAASAVLRALVARVAATAEQYPSYFLFIGVVVAEAHDMSPRVEEALRHAYRRIAAVLRALLERGVAEGSVAPDLDIATAPELFLGMYMGAILHQRLFRDTMPIGPAMTTLAGMMHASVVTAASPSDHRTPRKKATAASRARPRGARATRR